MYIILCIYLLNAYYGPDPVLSHENTKVCFQGIHIHNLRWNKMISTIMIHWKKGYNKGNIQNAVEIQRGNEQH